LQTTFRDLDDPIVPTDEEIHQALETSFYDVNRACEFSLIIRSPCLKPSSPFSDDEITKIRQVVRAVEEELGEQLSPDDRSEVIQLFKAVDMMQVQQ
jgi:hypothetical protein